MSVNGDSHPSQAAGTSRENAIRARLVELQAEIDELIEEMDAILGETKDVAQKPPFRVINGGLCALGPVGASVGVTVAAWTARRARILATGAVMSGTVGVVTVALLARGTPAHHAGAGVHQVVRHLSASASAPARPEPESSPPSSSQPRPSRTPGVPTAPVLVPARTRRPVVAEPAEPGHAPIPLPLLPTLSLVTKADDDDTPPPRACPARMNMEILGAGVHVCA